MFIRNACRYTSKAPTNAAYTMSTSLFLQRMHALFSYVLCTALRKTIMFFSFFSFLFLISTSMRLPLWHQPHYFCKQKRSPTHIEQSASGYFFIDPTKQKHAILATATLPVTTSCVHAWWLQIQCRNMNIFFDTKSFVHPKTFLILWFSFLICELI